MALPKRRKKMKKVILAVLMIVLGSYKAFAEDPKFSYKIGKGLTFEVPDENFKLNLYGFVQPRFTYNHLEAAPDTDTFTINRGKIGLNGTVMKTFNFGFMLNLATRGAAGAPAATTGLAVLDDYYVDWVPKTYFGIKVGQFKIPYLMQEITSDTKVQFVDRALANGFFSFVRDIGINLHGRSHNDRFGYNAFLFNGDGVNNFNSNQGLTFGTRLDYAISGKYDLSESDIDRSETPNAGVGLAYVFADSMNGLGQMSENGTIPAGTKAHNVTFDAGIKYKGFSFLGDGMLTSTAEGASVKNYGLTGQVGYMIVPHHVELAAKTSAALFNKAVRNEYEYALGFNYFIKGHAIKLATDYSYLVNARGFGLNDHRVRSQLQLMF